MADKVQSGGVGLPAGEKIGKYVLVERLAIGGQAIVYKAHDPTLDRHVAIKQISTHLAADGRFLERFRREAQILARLGSEQSAIVGIHELIEDTRGLFIVMEYVPGQTLEQILSASPAPLDAKAALQIIWRLAAGLNSVHNAGIIHRDIKPANIIIGEGLRPRIADFGVAASTSGQTSLVLGTTKYMAPEVFSGQAPDARMDMYALGFIAYEMLLGRAKFNEVFADVVRDRHSEPQRWMKWHGSENLQAPSLHEVNDAIPQALSDLVSHMMAKDPAKRFVSMEELGRTIKATFSPHAQPAVPAPAPEHRHRHHHSHHSHAGRPADPHQTGASASRDEVDQLTLDGPLPTAKLPRKQMSLQKKLIIAGSISAVLMAGFITMLGINYSKSKRSQTEAQKVFQSAEDDFRKGQWAASLDAFRTIAGRGDDVGAKAAALGQLAKAQLAVEAALAAQTETEKNARWEDAAHCETLANQAYESIQIKRGALTDWTRQLKKDIDAFRQYRLGSRNFDEAVTSAQAALVDGKYADAREVLRQRMSQPDITPTQEQNRRINELAKAINQAELKAGVTGKLSQAGSQIEQKQFDQAQTSCDEAAGLLEGPLGAQLARGEREALEAQLAQARKNVDIERKAAGANDEARNASDRTAELDALRRLDSIKPSPELTARIKNVESAVALERARQLKGEGKIDEARTAYNEALALKPDDSVKAELVDLDRGVKKRQLMSQAELDMQQGQWDAAVEKLTQAAEIEPETNVSARLTAARYGKTLALADSLRDQHKYADAVVSYEQAREINPSAATELDERLESLAQMQKYDELVAAGEKAFAAKLFTRARESYIKAQKVLDTADIKQKIVLSQYSENLELGKTELASSNFPAALGYLRLAQRYMDTEDVRKLIADAELKAQSKP